MLNKLVQILALLVVAILSRASATDEASVDVEVAAGLISMELKLKWDALWDQEATLEQVTAEEREEYLNEALMEISSKMKRKHKVRSLNKYNILKHNDEYVLVEYPSLTTEGQKTDEELKQLALQLLTTNVVNTISILRDGQFVDVFESEAFQKKADESFKKHQDSREQSYQDIRLKREREKESKRRKAEMDAILQETMDEEKEKIKLQQQAYGQMQESYDAMSDKLEGINKMIADMQAKHDEAKKHRLEYEKAHGITDGEERMQQAIAEARKRHADIDQRRAIEKATKEQDESAKEIEKPVETEAETPKEDVKLSDQQPPSQETPSPTAQKVAVSEEL